MTGLALACAVAGANVPVLLIERRALLHTTALAFDGRVTAIAQGSRHLLEAIGIWPDLVPRRSADPGHRGRRATIASHRTLRPSGGRRRAARAHRREPRDPARAAAPHRRAERWRAGSRSAGALGGDRAPGGGGRPGTRQRAARPRPPARGRRRAGIALARPRRHRGDALELPADRHRRDGRPCRAASRARVRALLRHRPACHAADARQSLLDRLGGGRPARARADRTRRSGLHQRARRPVR